MKTKIDHVEQLYSIKEVAGIFSLHRNAIILMIRRKELGAIRSRGKRGSWRIPQSEVLRWQNDNYHPAAS